MHVKRFDFDYSRRVFLEKTALGAGGAGVLTSLWPEICRSYSATKAYPEELLDIETFTKGQVKVGDVIDADNVLLVQDLMIHSHPNLRKPDHLHNQSRHRPLA